MSYKIKIIDNDSGRVIVDEDEAMAIAGAVVSKESTIGVYSTAGSFEQCVMAIHGAQVVCNKIKKQRPKIGMTVSMLELHEDQTETVEIDLSGFKKNGN